MFGLTDASSDQNGSAFNQFLARLLEVGKHQDVSAQANSSVSKTGVDASQTMDGASPAAAALAIAQIAARSKVLAACEEQKFNQYSNEALLLQLKRLEKRIEDLQRVESAAAGQGKVHSLKHYNFLEIPSRSSQESVGAHSQQRAGFDSSNDFSNSEMR